MKNRVSWLMIPVVALSIGACGKKEEGVKVPEVAEEVSVVGELKLEGEVSVEEAPAAAASISAEERAVKLGFVRYLTPDTEAVLVFQNGAKSVDRVTSSKVWKLLQDQLAGGLMPMDEGEEMDDIEEMDDDFEIPEGEQDAAVDGAAADVDAGAGLPGEMGPGMLFGTEFTMAMGKTTGEQAANLLMLNRRMTYLQMRGLAKASVAAAREGERADLEEALVDGYTSEWFVDLLKDPDSGMAMFERMEMPPLYLAFRVGEEQRPAAAQEVAAMLANFNMLGDMVEPVETEKAGQKFAGYKVSGAKISANLAGARDIMEESLDVATVDQLLAAVTKKDLVVLSGTIGDYVLLFLGAEADDLQLAGELGQSIVATDALDFTDAYASKELAAVVYGQKAAMDQLYASVGGLADITDGLRDGISGADGLGDTRDLEAMFQIVAEREAALQKLASNEALGTVVFYEDGLKIESYGGVDRGAIAWQAPNRLGHLGDSPDVVLFANMTVDAAYDEGLRGYFEALFETAYAMTLKLTELPIEDDQIAQFTGMVKVFDDNFRSDMIAMWNAYNQDFGDGLAGETAWVVDLKGAAPAVPGVPQVVVDKLKLPRIAMVSPIEDRAKLGVAWDKMNVTATGILGKVSGMVGQDLPMQKPLSSEKNELTTWFFPLPFFNDDFLPSVTLDDQWWAASTSKNQALELIGQAAAGGVERTGLVFTVNFRALESYAKETAKLMDENADALMGAPFSPEEMQLIEDSIGVLGELDKITVHSRREGAVLRSSVHFKTR
jgi:hypothetical protein